VLSIFVAPSRIQLLNCAANCPSFILTPSRASLTCCAVERSSFIRSASLASLNLIIAPSRTQHQVFKRSSFIRSASLASLNLIIAPSRTQHQVFNPLLTFFSLSWGVVLLLLSLWDYGSRKIFISAAYFGGLCFFGHSSICHS
jgi:hypothetical protein